MYTNYRYGILGKNDTVVLNLKTFLFATLLCFLQNFDELISAKVEIRSNEYLTPNLPNVHDLKLNGLDVLMLKYSTFL